MQDLDPKATDLEGYLFPDTYALPRSASAEDLVRAMVERFRKVLASEMTQFASADVSVRRVVTLASLVEKETARIRAIGADAADDRSKMDDHLRGCIAQ